MANVDTRLNSRTIALDLIERSVRRHRPVDDNFVPATTKLSVRDRAFVRLLVATVLRRLGQIDLVLDKFLASIPTPTAQDILRLGVAQLLFLKTPPHAAVDTAVALAKNRRQGGFSGLINAVLHKVADAGPVICDRQDAPRLNTPAWLWDSWTKAYGDKTAMAIAVAHLAEAPLDISVKNNTECAEWARRLGAEVMPTGSLRYTARGRIENLQGYHQGAWWVQDAAAALPAKVLLHALGNVHGKALLDLCAAPGGKTAQLAAAGAEVTAADVSKNRLALLQENFSRLNLHVRAVCEDATVWIPTVSFDGVLVDPPCSATGTIRRHPDVYFLKRKADVLGFSAIQKSLLSAASRMVRNGGYLLYTVCSLQPEEGPVVVDSFLAENEAFQRVAVPIDAVGGEKEFLSSSGELRTLPCHWAAQGGIDGFYGALMQRRG